MTQYSLIFDTGAPRIPKGVVERIYPQGVAQHVLEVAPRGRVLERAAVVHLHVWGAVYKRDFLKLLSRTGLAI